MRVIGENGPVEVTQMDPGILEQLVAHNSYQNQKLTYTNDGRLLDENGNAVMMGWEEPIMREQAKTITSSRGDILNVGFGMGIIDFYIQVHSPRTHWIIESHPDVQKKMIQDGWLKQPHVRCIFAKWQDVIHHLPKFDGVYWDTWEESPGDFFRSLPNILKKEGVFSFFNNPSKKHIEEGNKMDPLNYNILKDFMDIKFSQFEIPKIDDEKFQGRMYWDPDNKTYYNPICTLK